MTQGTQSIDRAAELLSLAIRAEEPVSFTELVETTGLARSTVSRLLTALERNGLLERTDDGRFRGGVMFTHYATRFDRVEALTAIAQPILERIAESTGETVNLGVPRGETVAHVAQIDSSYILGATNWVDVHVPTHCSALGKVLYAYGAIRLPSGALEVRTPATLSDLAALERDLEEVRRRGYAVTLGEFEEGLDAVAAPVHDRDGSVHASIGLSGPSFRFEGEHADMGKLLVAEAQRLSRAVQRLGRLEQLGP